jgi:UDPglucose 6-dehydrogenase
MHEMGFKPLKTIAMLGTGYVGLVTGTCFAEIGNRVICCDVDESKIENLKSGIVTIYEPGLEELIRSNVRRQRLSFTSDISSAIREADIVYIAVGTPMAETGESDLSYVKSAAQMIGMSMNRYKVVVIKSTVPVGTARMVADIIRANLANPGIPFDVVSNPEFLREGTAVDDCMNMERAVIGSRSDSAAMIIAELHEPFQTNILITDWESAEMIKYASNTFLATKISFINAIANICEQVGANVVDVAAGMGMDSRIGSKFLQAGIGYGGSCFPKDTHALVHIAAKAGYDFRLLKEVIAVNEQQKKVAVGKLKKIFGDLAGKKIAVLGLSYKPNTNDMRDAPSLTIIPMLLQEGARVKAFDPIATDEARRHFGASIEYGEDLYETLAGCDACLILTEWKVIREMDLDQFKLLMKQPVMVDGRNCFDPRMMKRLGIRYYSIGRPEEPAEVLI